MSHLLSFLAVLGLHCYEGFSLVVVSRSYSLVKKHRLSSVQASVVGALGLSSCGVWALKHSLNGCVALMQLLCDMWDPLRPRMEPASPALAGSLPLSYQGSPCTAK